MSTKVTFTLPADVVADATSGIILGEFNNWDNTNATSLKKQKDGSMKATLTLDSGRTYQYRYLLNDGRWVNDHTADNFVHVQGYYIENCVITVPEIIENIIPDNIKKDDLTKIEGIGKKIAELLITADIATFEVLSTITQKRLRSILDAAGNKFKMHNPVSWPRQSKLAAAGKWPELKKLQTDLKGGK
ncbi:MAG: glycoside hydrolase family 13 [Chitinophagaceae bacterium]|nr:glycoside hydrolase family 13 [Chitinophagaceae bacterium]